MRRAAVSRCAPAAGCVHHIALQVPRLLWSGASHAVKAASLLDSRIGDQLLHAAKPKPQPIATARHWCMTD